MADRLGDDPADLLDGLDEVPVLGRVTEMVEVDLLGDQPVELLAGGQLGPDRAADRRRARARRLRRAVRMTATTG